MDVIMVDWWIKMIALLLVWTHMRAEELCMAAYGFFNDRISTNG